MACRHRRSGALSAALRPRHEGDGRSWWQKGHTCSCWASLRRLPRGCVGRAACKQPASGCPQHRCDSDATALALACHELPPDMRALAASLPGAAPHLRQTHPRLTGLPACTLLALIGRNALFESRTAIEQGSCRQVEAKLLKGAPSIQGGGKHEQCTAPVLRVCKRAWVCWLAARHHLWLPVVEGRVSCWLRAA